MGGDKIGVLILAVCSIYLTFMLTQAIRVDDVLHTKRTFDFILLLHSQVTGDED